MSLKRSGFKPLSKEKLAELNKKKHQKALTKHATRSHRMPQDKRKPQKRSQTKTSQKGYKIPPWFNKIKLGSHGNTPAQKRYWKVVSDTYRKDDFEKYGGKCVSCPVMLDRWQDGQLAHYKAWSVCNAWFKFERKNLALSCPNCNRLSDGVVGHNFSEELKRRHGDGVLEWIEKENLVYRGQKLENWEIVDKVARLRPDLVEE